MAACRFALAAAAVLGAAEACEVDLGGSVSAYYDFVCDVSSPRLHYDGSGWAAASPESGCHHYVFVRGAPPANCRLGAFCDGCRCPNGTEVHRLKLGPGPDHCKKCDTEMPAGSCVVRTRREEDAALKRQQEEREQREAQQDPAANLKREREEREQRLAQHGYEDALKKRQREEREQGLAQDALTKRQREEREQRQAQQALLSLKEAAKKACEKDPVSDDCKVFSGQALAEASRTVSKRTAEHTACATRTSKCTDTVALEEARQARLDANSTFLKAKVDFTAAAERVACADLSTAAKKKVCQDARDATLKETIGAIQAIKNANRAQRTKETREHQKAEAASMQASDEVHAALQQAIARMQTKDEVDAAMKQAIEREEKAPIGATKAAIVVTSPIAGVTVSAVLGLAVAAAVISRRSRSAPISATHALVGDSGEDAAHEHCMK